MIIPDITYSIVNITLLIVYAMGMACGYILSVFFLAGEGDAPLFDASFLTGNFWGMLANLLFFHSPPGYNIISPAVSPLLSIFTCILYVHDIYFAITLYTIN